ncbi:hypothetical protein DWX94_00450 [Coprococcus eutactus]|uniref:Uncharacterized protein n=1 Tax=Coprococcus eutactus TaxID=33043 RepID=A0A3R5WMZ2_9FIRM|nr:hypothetical protein DWX94_00450 [Coprococcus eutactus]
MATINRKFQSVDWKIRSVAEAGRDLLVAEIYRINIRLRLSTSIGGGLREMRKFILGRCLRIGWTTYGWWCGCLL